jgi:pilus assembly protein Flp/PilA
MIRKLTHFLTDKSAATAIEYCIIAAGIALGILPVVYSIGPKLTVPFSVILGQLK